MKALPRLAGTIATCAGTLAAAGAAFAQQPEPWQLGYQSAASPGMEHVRFLHDWILLPIIIGVTILVLVLLAYCIVRFNARRNPTPSRTSHNTMIEVLWTTLPIILLVIIAIPSFRLLYYTDRAADPEMTIKAIGNQWYWSYEYPDHGNFAFDAVMLEENELKDGQPRLLTTDAEVVVPVDTTIRVLVTANDVLHSWAVPAFGVKMDGVPGRLNETWFQAEEEGVYYGQCSELCGARHGFMPIMVRVVSKEAFEDWVAEAKDKYARIDDKADTRLAEAAGERTR